MHIHCFVLFLSALLIHAIIFFTEYTHTQDIPLYFLWFFSLSLANECSDWTHNHLEIYYSIRTRFPCLFIFIWVFFFSLVCPKFLFCSCFFPYWWSSFHTHTHTRARVLNTFSHCLYLWCLQKKQRFFLLICVFNKSGIVIITRNNTRHLNNFEEFFQFDYQLPIGHLHFVAKISFDNIDRFTRDLNKGYAGQRITTRFFLPCWLEDQFHRNVDDTFSVFDQDLIRF